MPSPAVLFLLIAAFALLMTTNLAPDIESALSALPALALSALAFLLFSLAQAAYECAGLLLSFLVAILRPLFVIIVLGSACLYLIALSDSAASLQATAGENKPEPPKAIPPPRFEYKDFALEPRPRLHLGHFEPTPGYFTDPRRHLFRPSTSPPVAPPATSPASPCAPAVVSSSHSTVECGPVTPTSTMEPGGAQVPVSRETGPVDQAETIASPGETMDLDSSSAEVSQPHAAPMQVLGGIPVSLNSICRGMAERKVELEAYLRGFLLGVDQGRDVSVERDWVDAILKDTYGYLKDHRSQFLEAESGSFCWSEPIASFWGVIQPWGFEIQSRHPRDWEELDAFLSVVRDFGRYLGLPLQDLHMDPPPPQMGHQDLYGGTQVTSGSDLVSAPPPSSLPPPPEPAISFTPLLSSQPRRSGRPRGAQRPGDQRAGARSGKPRPAPSQAGAPSPAAPIAPPQQSGVAPSLPPPAAPAVPPQVAAPQKLKLSMADARVDEWGKASIEQLLALDQNDWGWSGNTQLWRYDGATHLVLDDDKFRSKHAVHVENQLEGVGAKFIRAVAILRAQSKARMSPEDSGVGKPQLLQNIAALLKKGGAMFCSCGGFSVGSGAWGQAVLLLGAGVFAPNQKEIRRGLRKFYGKPTVRALKNQFRAVEVHWLEEAPAPEASNAA
jgi:hypothetical protein